jgi:transcriptional regulator with XRE-family HTH domain
MRLDDYLKTTRTPVKKFAQAIGVARQTLHRYLAGKREPSFDTLAKIKEVTDGKVTADDFVSSRTERTS